MVKLVVTSEELVMLISLVAVLPTRSVLKSKLF